MLILKDFSKSLNIPPFFVVRAKSNLRFRRMYTIKSNKDMGVKSDQIGKLTGFYIKKNYPQKIRRVKYFDNETERTFVFLSNNFDITAEEIAYLYKKNRWLVELFFKWIKQHLKIKSFWGTTENAVRIQIYCAIITYCLVAIVGSSLKIERSTYEILQVLGISLLDKTPVNELFKIVYSQNVKEPIYNQLSINFF